MKLLWDFDGTIFDTYPAYTKIFQEVLGEDVSSKEIFSMLKLSFTYAIQHFQLSQEQEQEIRDKSDEIRPVTLLPFPFVEGVLKASDTNVIMTHKKRKEVEEILTIHGFDHHFAEIVAGDDGYPRKPDATSYRYLHDKYNLDLAIGDRELDIIPAKEIGMKTCLFQNKSAKADFYLDDYKAFFSVVVF
ncbi:HAD-IA family hydrolase [Bacillus sp. DJP31]|uniref:HAD-IA family hydrolase n=1 Tax=Bacillus sp. DJP31 TaxID=3409789 RepID=UPI003BB50A7B